VSNSSVFNIGTKILNSLQDLQLNERKFRTDSRGTVLTLKALADNANNVDGMVSNSLSADLRQCPGL